MPKNAALAHLCLQSRRLLFAKQAATCASPEARERYASIAKAWMEFGGQFVEPDDPNKKKKPGDTEG